MVIPGYDPSEVHEIVLESEHDVTADRQQASRDTAERARAAIVASEVPESITIRESERNPPLDALTQPVDLVGLEGVADLEVIQLSIEYEPSRLPPGASPIDVAVALETDSGYDRLESTVDLESTTVTATLPEPPSGETVVAVYEERDESTLGRVE